MKWTAAQFGDAWHRVKGFRARKAGVRARVIEHRGAWHFMLYRGEDAYNSLWHAPFFFSAEDAQREAEKAIAEGYPPAPATPRPARERE